ncbi:hypothetical protein BC829DRAFT_386272 [Chytridium lagenaria]|nr:hypothetical protein BC829DRAFT_386272 [Chytridium lagenaria]
MRAGFPATTVRGGTSLVTTLPAPITAPSPIVTPGNITAAPPIQTSFPITICLAYSGPPSVLSSGSRGW